MEYRNKNTKKTKIVHLLSLLALLSQNVSAQNAGSPKPDPEWQQQKARLDKWISTVNSAKCHFTIATFANLALRRAKKKIWDDAVELNKNVRTEPNDANDLYSYFWIADRDRWRCDKTRVYPQTGYDFSQYFFDGEKYTFFDEYLDRAIISGQDEEYGFVKGLRENSWLGLDFSSILDAYAAVGLERFSSLGQTVNDGRKCFSFQAKYPKGQITVDLDQQYGIPCRIQDVYRGSKGENTVSISRWEDIRKVDGIAMPWRCNSEVFTTQNGHTQWIQTKLFLLKECELNRPIGQGYFEDVLRMGTTLEDKINNPNEVSYVGGDLSDEAENVKKGTLPQPPELAPAQQDTLTRDLVP